MKITKVLLILLLTTSFAYSQRQETINSDRPGQSYSASTLGNRVVQLQSGINLFTINPSLNSKLTTYVNELRYGLSDKFEINGTLAYSTFSSYGGLSSSSDFSAYNIGGRYTILPQEGNNPAIALHANILFRIDNELAFRKSEGFFLGVNITQEIIDKVSISSNLRIMDDGNHPNYYFVYTLNTSVQLAKKVSAFVEVFGDVKSAATINLDGGVAILVSNDFQLDLSGGYLGFDGSQQSFVDLGISFRFGGKKN